VREGEGEREKNRSAREDMEAKKAGHGRLGDCIDMENVCMGEAGLV
jgi:hypothetical protein